MASGFLLYAVGVSQRVKENVYFRCFEGEGDKEQGNYAKDCKRQPLRAAKHFPRVEHTCLIDIRNRRTDKENYDIEPVGRFAECSVVGVE